MTDLSSITSSVAAVRPTVAAPARRSPVSVEAPTAPASRDVDSVSLSEHARLLDTLRNSDGIRHDVVDRVRGEIESGTYDISDEKLDKVVDGLLRDMFA